VEFRISAEVLHESRACTALAGFLLLFNYLSFGDETLSYCGEITKVTLGDVIVVINNMLELYAM